MSTAPAISKNYFKLKLFVIELFIQHNFNLLKTTHNLNKQQNEIKFSRNKVINLVVNYCREHGIIPEDYKNRVHIWENIVKTYGDDLFSDYHNSHNWDDSTEFLNNILAGNKGIDKDEIETLCGAVFKRSIASHIVSIELLEKSIIENRNIYQQRMQILEQTRLVLLEAKEHSEADLIEQAKNFADKKAYYYQDFQKAEDKLINTLAKLNTLSMNNLFQLGYTQDLQRSLLNQTEDNDFNVNIKMLTVTREQLEAEQNAKH